MGHGRPPTSLGTWERFGRRRFARVALAVNPVQQTSRIHREKSETRSLTLEDLNTVREALRTWATKQRPGPKASSDGHLPEGASVRTVVLPEFAVAVLQRRRAAMRSQDGGDPDLGTGQPRDRLAAARPLLPAITREFYISKPAIAADVAQDELAEADPAGGPSTSGMSGE